MFTSTAREAAWAIRSEAHQARLRSRGVEGPGLEEILRWVDRAEATKPP